jgi:hypothetical protein
MYPRASQALHNQTKCRQRREERHMHAVCSSVGTMLLHVCKGAGFLSYGRWKRAPRIEPFKGIKNDSIKHLMGSSTISSTIGF